MCSEFQSLNHLERFQGKLIENDKNDANLE